MKAERVTIGEVCRFIGGSQPPKKVFKSEYAEGYIRLIQTRDYKTSNYITYIPKNLARRFCNKEDIMIGRYGPPVFQILRGLEGAYNVALMKAVPKSSILNDYLYYFLKQESVFKYVDQLSKRTGGQTGVDLDSLNQYPVLLPDLQYQELVVRMLNALGSKIELNNKINSELESLVKAYYDYWFVQFDFPDANGKPYKTNGGKMVWNDELNREIPESWKSKRLFDLTSLLVRGVSPKYVEGSGISVLNQKCIRNRSINFTLGRRHDSTKNNSDSKYIQVGDVLVNSTGVGTLGRTAIVNRLEEPLTTVDSHITIVRTDVQKANKFFVGYSIRNRENEIEQFAEGSTGQTELSKDNLGNLKLVLPPDDLQLDFERFYRPLLEKIANNERESQNLLVLRDWLLPMLMNGHTKIGDNKEELAMAAEPEEKYSKRKR